MGMIPRKQTAETGTAAPVAEKPAVNIPKAQPQETAQAAAPQPQPTAQPQPQASVPAVQQGGAVSAKVSKPMRNPIKEKFENAITLEWNTLHRIQANQGNFLDLEANKASFGGVVIGQLMSFQPSWQISPGTDDPNDTQWVRYSDDGITTNKGEPCKEYLKALIEAGYDKAKMNARYLMALVIEETPMDPTGRMCNKIVQIDLSATSKSAFDQFMLENGYKESKGLITTELAESGRMKMTAVVKTRGNFSWTVVQFDNA